MELPWSHDEVALATMPEIENLSDVTEELGLRFARYYENMRIFFNRRTWLCFYDHMEDCPLKQGLTWCVTDNFSGLSLSLSL